MGKSRLMIRFALLLVFITSAHGAEVTGVWEKKEMDPRVGSQGAEIDRIPEITNVNLLPSDAPPPKDLRCDTTSKCTFDLHYFKGETFDLKDPKRKNFLFIAGGPGQFVPENGHGNRALAALDGNRTQTLGGMRVPDVNEGQHNIVYFHVRGAGQSVINRNNKYDQFLRAKFVVEDIEKLRQEVLGEKPWDAIYAHSWGTVVAQLYARKYGKPDIASGRPESRVKSLILSAPIMRKDSETPKARIKQTVSNLRNIYKFYRPVGNCTISDASYLKNRVDDFDENFSVGVSGEDLDGTDNLCFVDDARISDIASDVERILTDLEPDYGSVDFVKDHFDRLQRDPNFPASLKKYPLEFFAALRTVQMLGAPDDNALVFTQDTKSMVDMALIIGYYLAPQISPTLQLPCDPNGRFLTGAAARPAIKERYCKRLIAAKKNLVELGNGLESERAKYVFGAYDGVTRWVFKALNKDCFTGQDLMKFATAAMGPNDRKRPLREMAKKIGIDLSGTTVCGWDPGGDNVHSVPTLILAGSADAIIAGCQAEDFFNDGLAGPKVFLEFLGMGHTMTVADAGLGALVLDQTQKFSDIISKFVIMAPSQLAQFVSSVQGELGALKARVRRTENGRIKCP